MAKSHDIQATMEITFDGGKLFLNGLELGPQTDLSSSQAQKVFELCRQNQALTVGFATEKSVDLDVSHVNLAMPESEKVIFFAGSFSPWHKGHRACIENLPKSAETIQSLVVLPDFNPWKEVREEGLWPEVQDIWLALQELTRERGDLCISLYLGFLAEKATNPTVDWLPQAIGKKKWLLMGEDTFLNLHKWKKASNVLAALEGIYVCPRAAEEESVLSQKKMLLETYNKNLMIDFLEPHPYQNYSSTWARKHKK